jgi:hypothetical protein
MVSQFPQLTELSDEHWDAFSSSFTTGDDGQPQYNPSIASPEAVLGRGVDRVLTGNRSPEEAINWIVTELESLGFSP